MRKVSKKDKEIGKEVYYSILDLMCDICSSKKNFLRFAGGIWDKRKAHAKKNKVVYHDMSCRCYDCKAGISKRAKD